MKMENSRKEKNFISAVVYLRNNSNGIKPTPVPTPIPSVKPDLNPIEQTTQEPEYNENKSEEIVNEQDDLQNTGKIME